MYALFPMRSTCYVPCKLNSNSRMYFALKLHEVSPCPCPCPYPCLEGLILVLILVLEGQVLVLVFVLGVQSLFTSLALVSLLWVLCLSDVLSLTLGLSTKLQTVGIYFFAAKTAVIDVIPVLTKRREAFDNVDSVLPLRMTWRKCSTYQLLNHE